MDAGAEPVTAVYHEWVAYRSACADYCARTGMPDPELGPSGAPMARMYTAVTRKGVNSNLSS